MDTRDVRKINNDTMRYYVLNDIHGFYFELYVALKEKEFY